MDKIGALYLEIDKLKQKNYESYQLFYDMTSKYIYEILYSIAGEGANTIINDVYTEIYQQILRLHDNKYFYIWIGTVATDYAYKYVIKNYPANSVNEMFDKTIYEVNQLVNCINDDKEIIFSKKILVDLQYQKNLKDTLNNLSVYHKVVLQYYFVEGWDIKQISERTNLDINVIANLVKDIRETFLETEKSIAFDEDKKLFSFSDIPFLWILYSDVVIMNTPQIVIDVTLNSDIDSNKKSSDKNKKSHVGMIACIGIITAFCIVSIILFTVGISAVKKYFLDDKNNKLYSQVTTEQMTDNTQQSTTEQMTNEITEETINETTSEVTQDKKYRLRYEYKDNPKAGRKYICIDGAGYETLAKNVSDNYQSFVEKADETYDQLYNIYGDEYKNMDIDNFIVRADDSVLSVIFYWTAIDNNNGYFSHTYDVKTGKELSLSDLGVSNDEFEMLIREKLREKYESEDFRNYYYASFSYEDSEIDVEAVLQETYELRVKQAIDQIINDNYIPWYESEYNSVGGYVVWNLGNEGINIAYSNEDVMTQSGLDLDFVIPYSEFDSFEKNYLPEDIITVQMNIDSNIYNKFIFDIDSDGKENIVSICRENDTGGHEYGLFLDGQGIVNDTWKIGDYYTKTTDNKDFVIGGYYSIQNDEKTVIFDYYYLHDGKIENIEFDGKDSLGVICVRGDYLYAYDIRNNEYAYYKITENGPVLDESYSGEIINKNEVVAHIPEDAVTYNGHKYYIFINEADSWQDAKNYCDSRGGYLAVISDVNENDFLFNYTFSFDIDGAYFGYSDHLDEGNWKWITGNSSFIYWAEYEPNSDNDEEDYAMFYYKYPDGTWNDGDFCEEKKAFICEWD